MFWLLSIALAATCEERAEEGKDLLKANQRAEALILLRSVADCPGEVDKAAYYIARAYRDQGLWLASERSYLAILDGPLENPYWRHALSKAVSLAQTFDDDAVFATRARTMPEDHFGRGSSDYLNLLRGRALLAEGDTESAIAVFSKVATESPWGVHAGVELERLGHYGDVAASTDGLLPDDDESRVLAARYLPEDRALSLLAEVDRSSVWADHAALEKARITRRSRDLPRTWIPEAAALSVELGRSPEDACATLDALTAQLDAGTPPAALEAFWSAAGHQAPVLARISRLEIEKTLVPPEDPELPAIYAKLESDLNLELERARASDVADLQARIGAARAAL